MWERYLHCHVHCSIIYILLEIYPEIGLLDPFLLFEKPPCFPPWLNQVAFLPTTHRVHFLDIIANTCYLSSSYWGIPIGVKWDLLVILIYISLMISDLEHLSMYPLPIWISFLGKMSILFLCPFLMGFNWILLVIINVTKLHEFFPYWGY